jgi:hypothetical protein
VSLPVDSRSEKYLRFTRRSTIVLLLLVIGVGGTGVAMAFRPASPRWPQAMLPLWIVAVVVAVGLQRTLGGERWDPRAPEARAIAADEWRRGNMDRARRVAFVVVLGAQLPLALLLSVLPPARAAIAMAAATITVGLATLLALFLHFDRDAADAR